MSGDVEFSTGKRSSVFPEDWGVPPAGLHSEQRAAWVLAHARVEHVRQLASAASRARLEHVQRLATRVRYNPTISRTAD